MAYGAAQPAEDIAEEEEVALSQAPATRGQWSHALFVALAFGIYLLDQVSKSLVRDYMVLDQSIPEEGLVRISYVTNTGSAFGLLPNQTFLLTIASVVGIAVLIIFYRNRPSASPLFRLSLALQLGGAAGNLTDRILLGHVVDFIDIGSWPVFNVADSAIVIGIFLLAWLILTSERTKEPAPALDEPEPPDAEEGEGQ